MRTQCTPNSKKAYRHAKQSGIIASNEQQILNVLQSIRAGNTSEISHYCGLRDDAVHKRLAGMEKKGLIYKTNLSKRSRSTGQLQSVWCLVGYEPKVNFVKKK